MDSCAEDAWLSVPLFAAVFPDSIEAVDEGEQEEQEQEIGGIVWHGAVLF